MYRCIFTFFWYDISRLLTKWKNMPERTMHFPKKETWNYYNIIWNSAPCCCVISCFPFYTYFLYFSRSRKRKLRYSLPTLKIAAAYTSITHYNLSLFHQANNKFHSYSPVSIYHQISRVDKDFQKYIIKTSIWFCE